YSLCLTNLSDVFGLTETLIINYSPNGNFIASPIYSGRINEVELNCLKTKKVLLPKKRDQLAGMIEGFTGEELPVLALLYLKN
ncbi:MAG: hypothetical protein J7L89_09110, partial [Bacteroidales bacterium]|nr:hypothetical protein [Bacteroidales bacterium]